MRNLLWVLCLMLLSIRAHAQSCCSASAVGSQGCSDNPINNGLVSNVGVRYSLTSDQFHLASIMGEKYATDYRDIMQNIVLSGSWTVKDIIAFQAFIPFSFNQRTGSDKQFFAGLGDISFGFTLQTPELKYKNSNHRFYGGFLVQAPSGSFKKSIDTTGFAPMIQAGFGAWNFSPSVEYTFQVKKFSGAAGVMYRHTLLNPDRLQQGGRVQAWVKGVYGFDYKKHRFIPSLAVVYEHQQQNKFRDALVSLSGGQLLSLEPGFDVRLFEQFGIGCKYRQPIYQQLARGRLKQEGTFSLQFNYFFKSKN